MKYYLKDHGWKPEDAILVTGFNGDPELFAEIAAQHFFDYHDGWEASWPTWITVIDDDGKEWDYDVELSHVPEFAATERKL